MASVVDHVLSSWLKNASGASPRYAGLGDTIAADMLTFQLLDTWARQHNLIPVAAFASTLLATVSASGLDMGGGETEGSLDGWGAQVEVGSFPTSLIETTASSANRDGDDYVAGRVAGVGLNELRGIQLSVWPMFDSALAVVAHDQYGLFEFTPDDPVTERLASLQLVVTAPGVVDLQLTITNPGAALVTQTVTFLEGAELTFDWRPADGDLIVGGMLTGNGTYNHAAVAGLSDFDLRIGSNTQGSGTADRFFFGDIQAPTLLVERPEITDVTQRTRNSIRVTFELAPRRFDPAFAGDALHLVNYTLTHDAGVSLPLLQHVAIAPGNAVDLFYDQPLPAGQPLRLVAKNILTDDQLQQFGDVSAAFTALGAERGMGGTVRASITVLDIANPQTERDAAGQPLGTFQFSERGDLANDSGRAQLRKRIFRRLGSRPSGFILLDNYGLRMRDKGLVTPTLLRELQASVEAQVRGEPDVVAVRALLRELAPNVVGLRLRVEDAFGPFSIETEIVTSA